MQRAVSGQPAHRGTLKCRRNTRTAILSVQRIPDVRNAGLYIDMSKCGQNGRCTTTLWGISDRTLMTSTIRRRSPGTNPTVETNHPGRLSSARGSDLGGAHTADRRRDCPLNSRLTLSHVRRTSPFGLYPVRTVIVAIRISLIPVPYPRHSFPAEPQPTFYT